MEESPLHTISIPVPLEHVKILEHLYGILCARFENQYPIPNDWEPHLDVLTMRVKPQDSTKFIEKFKGSTLKGCALKLNLVNFSLSDDNRYLFINPDEKNKESIFKLRSYFNGNLGSFRDLELAQYYKERWDSYTHEQQVRVLKTGSLYDYIPHLSLIKLNPSDSPLALQLVLKEFRPFSFMVNKLIMNRQTFNEEKMFERVAEISLS